DAGNIITLRINFREGSRPFAPRPGGGPGGYWLEAEEAAPYVEKVFPIRPDQRAQIPAVTHVDGSGRLQTVSKDSNPLYHALISRFHERTGVPLVLNTSLNENEPIVRTPAEAISCFLRTDMDAVVLGPYIVDRHRPDFPERYRKRIAA
ncbi:MAG: carbamoyltransferase, partial [Planctomycetes bacterium]|nr:carbamoyltransferase [Planctomycetota bacterium]